MSIETVHVDVPGRAIAVEVYAPPRTPAAGILLLHELFGLADCYRVDARDLAERGYLVYAPDLYGESPLRYCIRAMVLAGAWQNRADSPVNREVHRLLDALAADSRCNGRLGMLGACLTGGYVLQMARRPDLAAPVLYHHSLGVLGSGVAPGDSLAEVTRLQAHFARRDPFCPTARREALRNELGDRLESWEYDMPHGFRSVSRGLPGSDLVWARTLRFFEENLIEARDS